MDTVSAYFQLVQERPELFIHCENVPLILDENQMRTFSEKTGKAMGLVYDNTPFYIVLADLCRGSKGLYSYARVIYSNPESSGCIAVVRRAGQFGLLRIFRHAPRRWSLEFPRGYAEDCTLTPEENVRKELSEELGVAAEECSVTFLGNVRTDTGLSNGCAQIFLAEFKDTVCVHPADDEGIGGFVWAGEEELRQMICDGEITDGLTLAAFAQMMCQNAK